MYANMVCVGDPGKCGQIVGFGRKRCAERRGMQDRCKNSERKSGRDLQNT